jgi:hypothetical protein
MKNIISIIVIVLGVSTSNGQLLTNSVPANAINNSSAFLDASTNYSLAFGENNNKHKGLVFPDVNLATFQFEDIIADGITFPTYYDGMVVYNTATGSSLTTGISPSTSTDVTPGFYYFSNPNGAANGNVTSGTWKPLGGTSNTSVKNITATEATTSTSIDGKQVYALTGTFTAVGIAATVKVTIPTGMTGYYKMTTFQGGRTFREGITSFNIDPLVTADNVVTGNGMYNEVYPAGTYTYTLEYFK